MIPAPLRALLDEWLNRRPLMIPDNPGYNSYPNPVMDSDLYIVVKREITIQFPNDRRQVIVRKAFQTSLLETHPTANENRLRKFLDVVDEEFVKKVFDTESDMINTLNPPGFF